MKKLFLMLFALPLFFAACSDDDFGGNEGPVTDEELATENNSIVDGVIVKPLTFLGSYTVTDPKGGVLKVDGAKFSIRAKDADLGFYMHEVRFADKMPPLSLRCEPVAYTGEGNGLGFRVEKMTPDAYINGAGWQAFARYPVSELEGEVKGLNFEVRFVCTPPMGRYVVAFEGRLMK